MNKAILTATEDRQVSDSKFVSVVFGFDAPSIHCAALNISVY